MWLYRCSMSSSWPTNRILGCSGSWACLTATAAETETYTVLFTKVAHQFQEFALAQRMALASNDSNGIQRHPTASNSIQRHATASNRMPNAWLGFHVFHLYLRQCLSNPGLILSPLCNLVQSMRNLELSGSVGLMDSTWRKHTKLYKIQIDTAFANWDGFLQRYKLP